MRKKRKKEITKISDTTIGSVDTTPYTSCLAEILKRQGVGHFINQREQEADFAEFPPVSRILFQNLILQRNQTRQNPWRCCTPPRPPPCDSHPAPRATKPFRQPGGEGHVLEQTRDIGEILSEEEEGEDEERRRGGGDRISMLNRNSRTSKLVSIHTDMWLDRKETRKHGQIIILGQFEISVPSRDFP